MPRTVRSLSCSATTQVRSSARLADVSTYWYCDPPERPPPRRSWAENRKVCTPFTFASAGRRRLITASDDAFRSASGFRAMLRKPRFIALQPLDTPTLDATDDTA